MLRRLLQGPLRRHPPPPAAVPDGTRIYAVGDIHGRLDLLDRLLALIDADDRARPAAETTIVFLGDLIDRGPDSAGVIERLRGLGASGTRARFLLGNHEEVFLAALAGDRRALRGFCQMGGRETLLSYSVTPDRYERMGYDELADVLPRVVPASHRAFLARFEDMIVVGDYAFVHAGVDPTRSLDAQRPADLRWIREPFLDHPRPLARRIVHGHTISDSVAWRPHRIGIDTGAYRSGILTALGLEGEAQWLVST